ncbi:Ctf8-domain-containing protein [Protomyces lactucae-debilis]|uniref:Ctf8-domain-containing protein n=1 Tax=Protomyces lactucae-debilis TaxID=2754530 RepID=A0A1Y2ERG6_PROLT|nr:Ctf8-domain-containing protein [Protomyces lactucae-debilis]ORY74122.1 Ctf8-domain-containing protein [Protomyces lactucae-debilis]
MESTIHIPALSLATGEASSSSHFIRLAGSQTLCFLELQGAIQKLDPAETRLGKLVEEPDGRIFLYVGYQKMEGKLIKLKKPFAVLKRPTSAAPSASDNDAVMSSQIMSSQVQKETSESFNLELVDIVTKKIYFGQRPEPLGTLENT